MLLFAGWAAVVIQSEVLNVAGCQRQMEGVRGSRADNGW